MGAPRTNPIDPASRDGLSQKLEAGAASLGLTLAPHQIAQLLDYVMLLVKWNAVYNLTAVRDPVQMVSQHLLDSLSVVLAFKGATRVLDVGAGGGLPGIVLAIWASVAQPSMHISLVDAVHKKTAFLTQVKAELGLHNVTVYTARVERLQVEQRFDLITSRAFAELADFVRWSEHLLAPGGEFIAMKGVAPQQEIDRLPPGWVVRDLQVLTVPTLDAERHLLRIARLDHAGATEK